MRDLDKVIDNIKDGFIDPLGDNSLKDFILLPSKRIRSKVAILYLKAFGKELTEDVYNVLAAGEIIHNASLLHDDVLDGGEFRRGKETIFKQFGSKISVLSGDFLLSYGIEKIINIDSNEILTLFKECTKLMILAEIKQYSYRGKLPKIEEYIDICKGKTAALFSAVLESSALLLGLDKNFARSFGEVFGVYFQLKNDLEKDSAEADNKNGIYTSKDILGIEKNIALLDNYRQRALELLGSVPDNEYKYELKDLLTGL